MYPPPHMHPPPHMYLLTYTIKRHCMYPPPHMHPPPHMYPPPHIYHIKVTTWSTFSNVCSHCERCRNEPQRTACFFLFSFSFFLYLCSPCERCRNAAWRRRRACFLFPASRPVEPWHWLHHQSLSVYIHTQC